MNDYNYEEWSSCSKPCGGGTRERRIKNTTMDAWEHCDEILRIKSENCNEFNCEGKMLFIMTKIELITQDIIREFNYQ